MFNRISHQNFSILFCSWNQNESTVSIWLLIKVFLYIFNDNGSTQVFMKRKISP